MQDNPIINLRKKLETTIEPLPVDSLKEDFTDAHGRGNVCLIAPTGSGKSTRIPLWCAASGEKVVVVEPRRVACRSLARYLSSQLDSPLGGIVGYTHRHDDKTSDETLVRFVTPGVALKMLQEGNLKDFDTVILDEYHERGLESDLVLALCLIEKTRIIVMSATLQGERVAEFIDASLLMAEGRVYPVDVSFLGGVTVPSAKNISARVLGALRKALNHEGDILVFLPGKGEINACKNEIESSHLDLETLVLHGNLSPKDQDKAFLPGDKRRVILATNVAETSVTLPGIGVVIDSGLVRQTRYRDGRSVLSLVPVTVDSAEQRRGRAGRLGPGYCYRLWDEGGILQENILPEILRESLQQIVLHVADSGYRIDELRFLDQPKDYAIRDAEEELRKLGALNSAGKINELGHRLQRLPIDVHLGRIILEAENCGAGGDAVDLVAILAQGRPIFLPKVSGSVIESREIFRKTGSDGTAYILALRKGEPLEHGLQAAALGEARKIAAQLRETLSYPPLASNAAVNADGLARAIMRALPENVYVKRKRGWGNGIREVGLAEGSFLKKDVKAIIAVETISVTGKGRKVMNVVTCALPCSYQMIVIEGLGKRELISCRIKNDRLIGIVARVYAGQTIEVEEDLELTDDYAVEGAARLLLDKKLLSDQMEKTLDDIDRWNLHCLLGGNGETVNPKDWLRGRLKETGFSKSEDVRLLMWEDLVFDRMDEEEKEDFDREYPRTFDLGDSFCRVEYDLKGKNITLVKLRGLRREPPNLNYLPSWKGWKIRFQDRQRIIVMRG